jgi:hypothetical protein
MKLYRICAKNPHRPITANASNMGIHGIAPAMNLAMAALVLATCPVEAETITIAPYE